ncbi:translation initiation factor IF-3 [Candidatus Daviesbacteria bacterium]|nr:translation initiation factor IF-3 [Candidatus Daviesbacteria bacterium]
MGKFYRLNEHIQASKLRVIDGEGTQLGLLTKDEALKKAKDQELDLVEVAPNADPPVARIVDFQKFRYQENKKEHAAKKGGEGELKELWLSPRIAEHDLKIRLDHALEFLKEGHKVKLTVKFKGREMAHPEFGHLVLQKALDYFGSSAVVEREAKFEGRKLSIIVIKSKKSPKEEDETAIQDKTKN